jgi:hypothetical protein
MPTTKAPTAASTNIAMSETEARGTVESVPSLARAALTGNVNSGS